MTTVIVSSGTVTNFPEGGGHLWVRMQYMQALRLAGCDVYWMERFRRGGDPETERRAAAAFFDRAREFGLEGKTLLNAESEDGTEREWLGISSTEAEAVLRRADLLLNFYYAIDPDLLGLCRRTALMDVDPGLLQWWITTGALAVAPHDVYFTIGETVGTPQAGFPDCGLQWTYSRPPVCLDLWPPTFDPASEAFTTVASWWSGHGITMVEQGREVVRENAKRNGFQAFVDLPRHTSQPLEMALYMAKSDAEERRRFENRGWRIRDSRDVARTPRMYQKYIQSSRGEFSCAKPVYVESRTAWVSDRTLCYLASGKPVVVQHTGPSTFLPDGEGMFRFTTLEEAAAALEAVNADYERHCRAARDLAERYFDARKIVERILDVALG